MINNSDNQNLLIVLTTESDMLRAKKLGRYILEQKLAACISFQFISASYWWNDKIEESEEVKILIKTNTHLKEKLFKAIKKIHSYDTPELIYWTAFACQEYNEWIDKVTLDSD